MEAVDVASDVARMSHECRRTEKSTSQNNISLLKLTSTQLEAGVCGLPWILKL
jgi:hypothetical protein